MLALYLLSRACTLLLSFQLLFVPLDAIIPLLDDPAYPPCGIVCEECFRVLSIDLDFAVSALDILPTDTSSTCDCPAYNFTVNGNGLSMYQSGRAFPIGKLTPDPDNDRLELSVTYWNGRQLNHRCVRPYVPNTDECLNITSLRGQVHISLICWFHI